MIVLLPIPEEPESMLIHEVALVLTVADHSQSGAIELTDIVPLPPEAGKLVLVTAIGVELQPAWVIVKVELFTLICPALENPVVFRLTEYLTCLLPESNPDEGSRIVIQ